ncbi:FAD-dependent oxidoreductase [Burkholderia sp. 8Y]|uniref:FAD-dependent oxidoreductase n=1 Tax=Burkholderia sp. 8Y TaxID=2653133 RepID=UPI00135CCA5F|nr:FAD-dependent oxidoreductase [Burkholderia sp. 8Y]
MQKVAALSDFDAQPMKCVEIGDTPILLIRSGETIHGYQAKCPHAGAPLEEGALCNGRLVCPWHKGTFEIESGAIVEPPPLMPLKRYPVKIDGDNVLASATPLDDSPARDSSAQPDTRTFAIIGAGAAGAAACSTLRQAGFTGRIVLIEREPRTPYDRTSLSKFVPSGEMSPDEVPALLPDDFFERESIDVIQAEVATLDAGAKRIDIGSAPSIHYDAALVACGGIPKRPSLQAGEAEGVAEFIRLLRGRDDARGLLETATPKSHALVLGASFIGLEVAAALRGRDVAVTVVSPGNVPFEKQFGPQIARLVMGLHESHGVQFRMGRHAVAVKRNDEMSDARLCVTLDDGATVDCDFVVAGLGIHLPTDFVAGVERNEDGSLDVDASMRVADGLFAAGDIARFDLPIEPGGRIRVEHWRLAQQHARIAAHAMLGSSRNEPFVPFFWTYHFDKTIEYLGHARQWDQTVFTGSPEKFEFIALFGDKGKLVAAVGCERNRQMGALAEAMRETLSVEDALKIAEGS